MFNLEFKKLKTHPFISLSLAFGTLDWGQCNGRDWDLDLGGDVSRISRLFGGFLGRLNCWLISRLGRLDCQFLGRLLGGFVGDLRRLARGRGGERLASTRAVLNGIFIFKNVLTIQRHLSLQSSCDDYTS